jgi:hypothetical protein
LASGKVRRPDGATERPHGILQNAPALGEAAQVRIEGISKLRAGGALTEGALIKAEYVSAADAGKGLATTSAGDYIRGLCVEPAGAEDVLASVRLVDFYYAIT